MKVRNVVPFLLIVTFPITGAILDGNGPDTDIELDHELGEDSTGGVHSNADFGFFEATETASQLSFLSPSVFLEGIQNAYLSPATPASTAPDPSSSDFWETAKKFEKNLQNYAQRLLEAAAKYFNSAKFTDITSAMNHIVSTTSTFRNNIKEALDAHQTTFDMLTEELETIFAAIANDLEKIPHPDKAPGHAERAEMVDKVLDNAGRELVKLAARYGIEEEVVSTYIQTLKPHVLVLTVAVGDINEQYPQLLSILIFCVTVLLVPQSWMLRSLLGLFGFGPVGIIRGSAAAWMQRYFWGAAVQSGSWFAWLQAAGMGVYPVWAGLVAKIPLLAGGVLGMLFNRG